MKKSVLTMALALMGLFSTQTLNAAEINVHTPSGEQTVPQQPKRVVVLDFAALDIIRALGEKSTVVGVTKSGVLPQYLAEFKDAQYENIGSPKEADFEKINELKPDLIIAATRQEQLWGRLQEIAPVYKFTFDYHDQYAGLEQNVLALGKIFDREAQAKEKLAALDKQISHLQASVAGKNALVLLVNESNLSAYGDTSRYAMVYQKFGFTPVDKHIKSSTHGQKVGFEYVLEQNPDYLLVIDRSAAVTNKTNNAQKVLDNAIVKQTQAAKSDHIVYLDPANWYLAFGGLEATENMVKELESAVKK
ncbi:siderophore ABC transporter substrate-binding protein [Conservatibacter flavescens]|uniref:ABC transporter n=1 Tax=Conservatibacter flavescens TaxID=28161 RepID=A0A2M8S5A8_9PAST|nr:ABC transporter substrate-binding protein [Conservatibacter flavescens]PJG86321.1 ABC transporter [Conservatibacter flavescens]